MVFEGFTGTIIELRLVDATYVIGICEEAIEVAIEFRLFAVIYGFWKFEDTTEEFIELRFVGVP